MCVLGPGGKGQETTLKMEGGLRSCDVGKRALRKIPGSWREVFEGRETWDLKGEGADASKRGNRIGTRHGDGDTGAVGSVVQRM